MTVELRVEVCSCVLKLRRLAQVDHRLAEPFGKARFPVGARIVVSEISEDERCVPDLGAHDVVDHPGGRHVAHVDQIEA